MSRITIFSDFHLTLPGIIIDTLVQILGLCLKFKTYDALFLILVPDPD